MKKSLVLILSVFSSIISAQFQRDVVLLGASGNYLKQTNGSDPRSFSTAETTAEYTSVRVNPGYFLSDRNVLGILFQFTDSKTSSVGNNGNGFLVSSHHYSNFGAGLFYRYYLALRDGRFAFFIHVEGSYLTSNGESVLPYNARVETAIGKGYEAIMRPGLAFALNKKIALEASFGSFGYTKIDYENNNGIATWETTDSKIGAGFTLSGLLVGFSFYLGADSSSER